MGMTLANLRVSGKVPLWIDLLTNMLTGVVMCMLDSPWLSPYLFVSLCGWPVGIQLHPDSAVLGVCCQDLARIPGITSEPGIISTTGADRPKLGYGTVFQSCIAVLQCGFRQAAPRPSLLCVCAVPDAGGHLAPLRDTIGCSPDDNAPATCPDFAPDVAPATLQSFAETYLACGFGLQCLPCFAHRPSDLMTLSSVLSVHRGFCVSFVQPLSQPASSDQGELIT